MQRPGKTSAIPETQQLDAIRRRYFDPHPLTGQRASAAERRKVIERLQKWITSKPEAGELAAGKGFGFAREPTKKPKEGAVPFGQRALATASLGVPLASGNDITRLLSKLDPGEAKGVVAGFPVGTAFSAQQRNRMLDSLEALGRPLPPGATDKDILEALYNPPKTKSKSGFAVNFLKDAILSTAGIPAGGYALGYAGREALRGNYEPAREAAAQTKDFVESFADPDAWYEQPFSHTLGVYAGGRGLAGGAGAAARRGVGPKGFQQFAGQAGTKRTVRPAGGLVDLPD